MPAGQTIGVGRMRSDVHAGGLRPRAHARERIVSRSWKWGVSVIVLATVLAIEYGFLHERIGSDVSELLASGRSAPAGAAAVAPDPAPPAPAATGDVTRVELRAMSLCSPGAVCAVRVHIGLHPRPTPVALRWSVRIDDLCSRASATVAGGSVTVPPNGDRADVVDNVALPPGSALAVTAVTSSPATAAGPPLRVPARASCSST
ncbi:MAG: hypothetical protein QOG20_873 [Pseudonocardiales bacterium]|nr:hypothetical protein [Pseudonocardiales bacterium]